MSLSLLEEPPAHIQPSSLPLPNPRIDRAPVIRSATLHDARSIHHLICKFTADGTLLPRPYAEIRSNIHTFIVAENSSGFIGCAALHIYGPHLAEIRSVAVDPSAMRQRAGSLLVEALLRQATAAGIKCVCLFTRVPVFFGKLSFRIVERQALPDKVAKDCAHCSRNTACDEIAMVIGELPAFLFPASQTARGRYPPDLVQLRV